MEIDKNITVPSNKYKNTSNYNIINTNEMNNFITLCKNKTLLNKNPKYSQKPKITALLPVYNANEFIISTIRSIQNQNMEDIEIIIVDDCSTDNSLEVIERLQKEDKRIKLIKNQINRGTLYSRSIGALNSKGKYIMTIDNDDYFTNNIFNISYEEAENDDIQLLEFTGCDKHINSLFKNNSCTIDIFLSTGKRDGEIIRQPELSDYIYVKKGNDYSLIDLYLWGKCIRSSLYKKALKTIGEAIYTQNVCWSEDRIVNFALFRIARSFKFIKIIGIIHNWRATSVGISFRKNQNRIFHDELINVNSIYYLTKNSKSIDYAAFEFKDKWRYSKNGLSLENKELAKNIYNKIINEQYISEFRKQLLINLTKNKLN